MSRIRNEMQLRLWPRLVQCPRRNRRTHNIIPTLHNSRRNMPNLINILLLQQLALLQPRLVLEIMALHARMRKQPCRIIQLRQRLLIRIQRANRYLPLVPRPRRGVANRGVLGHQPLVVRVHVVGALVLGQERHELVPRVREKHGHAAGDERPFELEGAHGEDAAQDEAAYAGGVRLRVGQREGGAPGPAEDGVPFGDLEVSAESFDVGDEVPGCVIGGRGIWAGLTAASLVEENNAVVRGVEEDGVGFCAVPAWTAVEIYDYSFGEFLSKEFKGFVVLTRLPILVAILLIVELMRLVYPEPTHIPRILVLMDNYFRCLGHCFNCWGIS